MDNGVVSLVGNSRLLRSAWARRPIAIYAIGVAVSLVGLGLSWLFPQAVAERGSFGQAIQGVLVVGGVLILLFSATIQDRISRHEFNTAFRGYIRWVIGLVVVTSLAEALRMPLSIWIGMFLGSFVGEWIGKFGAWLGQDFTR